MPGWGELQELRREGETRGLGHAHGYTVANRWIEERFLHCAAGHVRSEANVRKMRPAASVEMTSFLAQWRDRIADPEIARQFWVSASFMGGDLRARAGMNRDFAFALRQLKTNFRFS